MSRLISDILGASEPHFSHALRDLEHKSGKNGHDVRLSVDVSQLKKHIIKELGFDETDTTIQELYYALRHRGVEINAALEQQLNITNDCTPEQVSQAVHAFVDSMSVGRDIWAVKHSVIKQILKKQPPKKLMKALGLRSIDSVLKRTSSYELLTLAYQLETAEWIQKTHVQFKKFTPSDFQATKSTIYLLDAARISKMHTAGFKKHAIVVPNYETGSVLLMTPEKRFPLDTLAITLAVLQSLYDIRVYSAYFRFISVKQSFGHKVYNVMRKGLPGGLHGNQIGWRALQKYCNQHPEQFGRIEQPHLQFDDIALTTPADLIAQHVSNAKPWIGTEFGFVHDGTRSISLHLSDVVTNASNQLSYEQSRNSHGQAALWDELSRRYLTNESVVSFVIMTLDEPGRT